MNLNPSPASNTSGNDATTHHGCFSKNTGIDTFIIIFRVLAGYDTPRNWNPALAGEQFASRGGRTIVQKSLQTVTFSRPNSLLYCNTAESRFLGQHTRCTKTNVENPFEFRLLNFDF